MPKYELELRRPLMNAAGSLGFAPDPHAGVDLARFGAFVTNPISPARRLPARGARLVPYAGGFLMHTGYPNPGLRAALERYALRWQRSPLPIWVHLLAGHATELSSMVARLELSEGVAAIEIGLPPEVDEDQAAALTQAAVGELPVVARLPLEKAVALAGPVWEVGAAAVSLAPPRGALAGRDATTVYGRLYGPAVFPQALAKVAEIAALGVPVIGAGGVYQRSQIDMMLDAGALAVQLDAVLWRGDLI